MKGLLLKDFNYFKSQKMFLIVIVAICAYFIITGTQTAFIMCYAAGVFSMLVLSTISVDEQDNGMGYLFTLPIHRISYVREKYVLGLLLLAIVVVVGSGSMAAVAAAKSLSYDMEEWFAALLGCSMTASLVLSVTLPLQLKFGADKGRIVMFVAVACFAGLAYSVQKIAEFYFPEVSIDVGKLLQASTVQVTIGMIVLMMAMLGISYLISGAIMKKKQF